MTVGSLRLPTVRTTLALALAALVVLAGFAGTVQAQTAPESDAESVKELLRKAIDGYTDSGATIDVPGKRQVVGPLNVYVDDGPETYVYSLVVTPDLGIEEFAAGPRADATRRAVTDYATIQGIVNADNPPRALEQAVRNGDIRVEGEDGHPIEKIKWAILNFLRSIFGGFL
jgi:hypothetical protein